MNAVHKILTISFVKEFYRENAGVFIFSFIVMFGVVGNLHFASVWWYHYSLIMGMLNNPGIFGFILIAWFLYARKCVAFVMAKMKGPDYAFLQILMRMDMRSLNSILFVMHFFLYLPILTYTIFILIVAVSHHYYFSILIIIIYQTAICYGGTAVYRYQLQNPESTIKFFPQVHLPRKLQASYSFLLFRYIVNDLKMIVIGIKVFSCGVLFLLALNNTGNYYDLQFPFLFFSFGILANGIVVHRLRQFEERAISFYRGLPVSIGSRFLKYVFIYLVYFLPEILTIASLYPAYLHLSDAIAFMLCGYGLLMMLNSISLIAFFEMKVYLRIVLLLYSIVYLFTATYRLTSLYILLLTLSTFLFFLCYYRYEHSD